MSDEKVYIDGSGLILGRLSSWIAKNLLSGQDIIVVNAKDILISGRRGHLISDRLQKRALATHTNPQRGPFYPRMPDRILKRTVRGMLPWKKSSGRRALRRLTTFIEIPEDLSEREFISIPDAKRTPSGDYITVGELARNIGWQHGVDQ